MRLICKAIKAWLDAERSMAHIAAVMPKTPSRKRVIGIALKLLISTIIAGETLDEIKKRVDVTGARQ